MSNILNFRICFLISILNWNLKSNKILHKKTWLSVGKIETSYLDRNASIHSFATILVGGTCTLEVSGLAHDGAEVGTGHVWVDAGC